MQIDSIYKGSCHCGAVEFEVTLPVGLLNPSRCNCSICRRKGALVVSVPLAALKLRKGEEVLTLYQFNTFTAKHYFCSVCGIYTHHKRRSNPDQYSVNTGCLDDIDSLELGEVSIADGRNHICDR